MPDMSDDLINFLLKAGSGGFNAGGGGGGGGVMSALNTAKGGGNPAANFTGSGKNAISDGLTNAAANAIASGVDKASDAKPGLFGKLKNTLSGKSGDTGGDTLGKLTGGGTGGAMDMAGKLLGDAAGGGNPMDALNKLGAGGNPMDALNKLGAGGNPMDALNKLGEGGAGGAMDMANKLLGDAAGGGNPMDALNKLGGAGGAMGMASKLLGGGGGNNSGNPACGDPNGPAGDLSSLMSSLENKINKTLETEIANNFTTIIDSILKNPTAQDTMTMAIASALKPSLDNAIANTSYLNEIVKKEIEPEIKERLLEFYEEYNTKSEKTKPEAFTSFIDKMKKIQQKVGDVKDAKKSLDILGGDSNFRTNHTTMKMGTVAKQLDQIIPKDVVNKKTKMTGGSRKRRQRRRTHKKRRN
jgi:hypothetical protein